MYFNGVNSYLSVPSSADFDFAGGDFTIEFSCQPASFPNVDFNAIAKWNTTLRSWSLYYNTSTGWRFVFTTGGTTAIA